MDVDRREVAEELGVKFDTLRKAIHRATPSGFRRINFTNPGLRFARWRSLRFTLG